MNKLNLLTMANVGLTLLLCYFTFIKTNSLLVTIILFSTLMFSTYIVKSVLEK